MESTAIMGPKRRRNHLRYFSVMLCLLVMFNNSQAMVLCIGEGGHFAIEAFDSRCCGCLPWEICTGNANALTVAGCSAQDDDCGSCLDIPISSGLVEAVQAPNDIQPDVLVLCAFELPLLDHTFVSQIHQDLKFLITQSYFTPLSSIILLI